MRRYLIIVAVMFSALFSYAQENIDMIDILHIEHDIISLENRINSLIKKRPELANIQGIKQYNILSLDTYTNKKEDYLDYSFLNKLVQDYYSILGKGPRGKPPTRSFLYRVSPYLYFHIKSSKPLFRKERKYLKATTLISDSAGNLIASGDARFITLVHKDSYFELANEKLAKMFFDKEIDFVFDLGFPFSIRYMIGIKEYNLYAFEKTKEGLKIYHWEEFMDCCFDKWVFQGK